MNAIDVVRSNFDSWNRHDADAVVAAFVEGGLYITPSLPEPVTGAALGDFLRAMFVWSSDFSLDLISIGDTGQRVALEWLAHGTNDGPAVDGTPATGKQYNLPGVSIVQVEDDKIRTERAYFDLLGLQYQLGLMEQKAPVAETK
jgi:steroid delta-isomerase-like uncharacterized protein